jgi:PKD repeat protein
MKSEVHILKSIRRSSLFLILLFLLGIATQAEEYTYSDSWGQPGFTVISQDHGKIVLNYSVTSFTLSPEQINGEDMSTLEVPGIFLPNDAGAPNLPGTGQYIAVPQGAGIRLNITGQRTETMTGLNISPAPVIPKETDEGPLKYGKDAKIYSRNAFYPAEPVRLSAPARIRGVDVVILGITPFQYNPVTKELIVYRDVQVEITFEGGNGHFGEDRLRSRWWDPILSDMLINYSSLPKMNYNRSFQNTDEEGAEYLIICPDGAEFQSWADSIRVFRTLQGISTKVSTLTEIGGNTTTAIENYVNNAYNTWTVPPAAALVLGDYGTNANNSVTSPIWDGYCVSDNIYADVDNDDMPEVSFARITANNDAQLQVMVTKFLDYERNPPTDPNFYKHPITALGWQTERWFQICSETVGGYWRNVQGKEPVRINAIYSGTPGTVWSTATNTTTVVNFFGPSGLGYIPQTPAELGGWTGGNATMVNNAINAGSFMMQHRDHGYEQGWGEPDYSSTSINGLTNTDLCFVWSVNCLTGKYNYSSEVFAEKFHRYTAQGHNSGALGIIAASEVSYSFVNDTYVWGAYDNMWPDFMPSFNSTPEPRGVLPCFANAAGKYFLQQSSWPYNTGDKEVTYNLFHHHGDAFLTVYSEVPQALTVVHDPVLYAGVTTFTVTANENSLIALTVNGEIIGTATGTGAPLSIIIPGQVPPDQMVVTVTKQNYYRYSALVDVIPPTGPYVVKDSYTINDVAGGNGDGLMDYGETNLLTLVVKNVGVQQANNVVVTLSTTDPYITITDATANYGNIAPGATATVTDGFAYDVANNLPDLHAVSIEVSATDGTNTWLSYISIQGHAPVLEYVSYTISDPQGNNNGKLDPGETANIIVTLKNTGSSQADNVIAQLAESNTYLTVNTPQASFGNLAPGLTGTGTFSVTAASNTPAGEMVTLDVNISADLGITGSGSFFIVIGQIPVLILNLDPNNSSAPAMKTAIEANGVSCEVSTTFPADLNLYTSVFVCLGIYSNNHVLSSSEGTLLANYLTAGGAIYMEGGDTWYYDTPTAVHAMFNINGESDGSSDLGTIVGYAGTFTENMSFQYSGENNWIDHISAIAPAIDILKNVSPSYGTGVAYDAGTYRTIGTSHEFGGLTDATFPSTKTELMRQYLIHLDVIPETVMANFNANNTNICAGETVQFTDASLGNVISWSWTFEGGTPSSSTLENPQVTYNNAGTFDVTLIVSDGTDADTLTKTDYIVVSAVPGTATTPTGPNSLCEDPLNTTYNTTSLPGATSYNWLLEPANAGVITGTSTNATVNWDNAFTGTATIKVRGVNACGDGNYSAPLSVVVHEKPVVTLQPFDPVNYYWAPFLLTGGSPAGGTYSGPGVTNNMFDPGAAGVGTHTITYTYEDQYGCSNFAQQDIVVDLTTGVNAYDKSAVRVYPNPSNGSFRVYLNTGNNQPVDVRVYNSLNQVVYEGLKLNAGQALEISLGDVAEGLYLLHITGSASIITRKILVE